MGAFIQSRFSEFHVILSHEGLGPQNSRRRRIIWQCVGGIFQFKSQLEVAGLVVGMKGSEYLLVSVPLSSPEHLKYTPS